MQLLKFLQFFPSTSATVTTEFLNFPSDYYSIQLFMYIKNGQRNSGNHDKCSRSRHLSLPKQRTSKTSFKVFYSVKHCGLFFQYTCLYIDIRYFHWATQLPNYTPLVLNVKTFEFFCLPMCRRKKKGKETCFKFKDKNRCCQNEFQVIL